MTDRLNEIEERLNGWQRTPPTSMGPGEEDVRFLLDTIQAYHVVLDQHQERVETLRAEIARLREALQFYCEGLVDGGERARKVLGLEVNP